MITRERAEEAVRNLKRMGYIIGENSEGLIAAIIAANDGEDKPAPERIEKVTNLKTPE